MALCASFKPAINTAGLAQRNGGDCACRSNGTISSGSHASISIDLVNLCAGPMRGTRGLRRQQSIWFAAAKQRELVSRFGYDRYSSFERERSFSRGNAYGSSVDPRKYFFVFRIDDSGTDPASNRHRVPRYGRKYPGGQFHSRHSHLRKSNAHD